MAFIDDKKKVAAFLYRDDDVALNDLQKLVLYAFDSAGNPIGPGVAIDADPGAEKVTNGSFTGAATGWTLTAGWTYSANTVVKDGNGTTTLSQNVSAVANEIYRVVYTVSGWSVGTCTVAVGGVSGTARGADGTYTEYITATGTGNLTFTPTNTARFTIDDVSVKRVGVSAADRVNAWVGDRLSAGVAQAGEAGLFIEAEDGTRHFFGDVVVIGASSHITVNGGEVFQITKDTQQVEPAIVSTHANGYPSLNMYKNTTTQIMRFQAGLNDAYSDTGNNVFLANPVDDGSIIFRTQTGGTAGNRLAILGSGALLINGTTAYADNGQLLEVNKSADDGGIGIFCWSTTDAERGLIEFHKSSSATIGTKAIVAANEAIGGIIWRAAEDDTDWRSAASIEAYIDATPGATTDMPGRLVFSTTPDASVTPTEALRIDSSQRVLIGGTTPYGRVTPKLEVNEVAQGGLALIDWVNDENSAPVLEFSFSRGTAIGTHTVVVANDRLGYLEWRGSDGSQFRQAAMIYVEVDGAVSGGGAADMPGRFVFATSPDGSATPTEALRISSTQEVRALAGNVKIANATDGGTGGMHIRSKRAVSAAMSGATVNIATQIPSGAIILGAQFNVDTLIEGATSWSAAFNTGSTTSLGSGYALAQNTKVNFLIAPEKASAATDITLTAAGSNFTAGVVEALVYYIDQTSMANA